MLTPAELSRMESWIASGLQYGESSQGLVGASAEFAKVSRDLADLLGQRADRQFDRFARDELAGELRHLAEVIESQCRVLRDDQLATASSMEVLSTAFD
jgi:hypothetical protein